MNMLLVTYWLEKKKKRSLSSKAFGGDRRRGDRVFK